MKKGINVLVAFICFSFFITSCGENTTKSGEKVEEKVEIPAKLSKNEKVKEYFNALDKVIDEYVNMVENLAETSKKAESGGEPSFNDAMSMAGDVTASALKMAPLLEKMDKMEQEGEILKEEMSPEEIEAFSKTYAKMITRFQKAAKKLDENK